MPDEIIFNLPLWKHAGSMFPHFNTPMPFLSSHLFYMTFIENALLAKGANNSLISERILNSFALTTPLTPYELCGQRGKLN